MPAAPAAVDRAILQLLGASSRAAKANQLSAEGLPDRQVAASRPNLTDHATVPAPPRSSSPSRDNPSGTARRTTLAQQATDEVLALWHSVVLPDDLLS